MGIGPLPYDRIVWYAERLGLEHDVVNHFAEVLRRMDNAYIAWERARQPKPKAGK